MKEDRFREILDMLIYYCVCSLLEESGYGVQV